MEETKLKTAIEFLEDFFYEYTAYGRMYKEDDCLKAIKSYHAQFQSEQLTPKWSDAEKPFRLKALINGLEGWKQVERIDFFQNTFGVFIKDSATTEVFINYEKIKCIADVIGNTIYGANHNAIKEFSEIVIGAFQSGGGSKEDAENYYRENFS